ncbi:MAG: DUF5126 domain-containing protein [Flavobacteriaceae bacterium]
MLTALMALISCSDDENVSVDAPANITAEASYGAVVFNWDFPEADNVVYVRVDYTDADGNAKHQKFSEHNDAATISGLAQIPYEFTVTAGDKDGNLSQATVLTVTPNQPPYLYVISTVSLEPTFGGVIVNWTNPSGEDVGINVVYTNASGTSASYVANSDEEEGTATISGMSAVEQTIEVYVTNSTGAQSASRYFTVTPWEEVLLDRSAWTIEDYDSIYGSQTPEKVLDGDTATFWHTDWSSSGTGFPHWFVANMQSVKAVTKVAVYNRNHNGNLPSTFNQFTIEGSLDNETWIDMGTFDSAAVLGAQTFTLDAAYEIQYIKFTALGSFKDVIWMAMAEFEVYGSEM